MKRANAPLTVIVTSYQSAGSRNHAAQAEAAKANAQNQKESPAFVEGRSGRPPGSP